MKRSCFAILCTIAVLAAGSPLAAEDSSAAIRAGSAAWEDALNAGELDALVALYTDDARVMPPNAAAAQGHEAVRESFGAMIDAGLGGELTSVMAATAGDIGHHVGTYEITTSGAVVDRGKFVEIWRREGDAWKISADIWNSDMAAAGPETLMIGTHKVEDAARWLAAWQGPESRREAFAAHGAPSVRVFQSPQDPNLTGLVIEVEDMNALSAWLASEDGAKAKAEDGVIDETLRILTEVK